MKLQKEQISAMLSQLEALGKFPQSISRVSSSRSVVEPPPASTETASSAT
jgi:hypothetical protein